VRSKLLLLLAAPLLVLAGSPAWAGTQTGKVTTPITRADGLVYFFVEGVASGKPACATIGYWMIKAEGTIGGKQQVATLIAAKVAGKTISVVGANTCTRWSDGEDVNELRVLD
jgi:hypothetical protein